MGGLLNLPSFTTSFPEINNTREAKKNMTTEEAAHRTDINGAYCSVKGSYFLSCSN